VRDGYCTVAIFTGRLFKLILLGGVRVPLGLPTLLLIGSICLSLFFLQPIAPTHLDKSSVIMFACKEREIKVRGVRDEE
jgi:hypothetical protein